MRERTLDINKTDDARVIVDGCKKNDRRYQQMLYNQTFTKMIGACLRYSSDYDEAMDFVQEGYIKVFEKILMYQDTGSLVGWIKTIIVNNLLDAMRKSSKCQFSDIDTTPIEGEDDSEEVLEKIAEDDKNAQRIVELVQDLPPAYRTVFNMYVVEDIPHKQIAEKLGITEGTSKSNFAKAKMKLKQMYIEKYGNIYE